MKHSILILWFLLSFLSQALANDGLCFKAIQGGVEVDVICAGQPVTFRNCSDPTPTGSTIIFYPGKIDASYDKNKELAEGETYSFPGVGKYIITLLINRGKKDANNQNITEPFEQEFEVKSTPIPTFAATACANRKVIVTLTDPVYDKYLIDYGDSNPVTVVKGESPAIHTYTTPGPYTIKVTGSFENSVCNSSPVSKTVEELPTYSAPVISKIEVVKQDETTGSILFTFQNLITGYTYSLNRKLESENNFTSIVNIDPGQTTYNLSNTNTTVRALYRIEATDVCGAVQTPSNTADNIILKVTTAEEKNTIVWQSLNTSGVTELYRNNVLMQSVNQINSYIDQDVIYGQEYCYKVVRKDNFESVSAEQCVLVMDEQDAQLYIPSAFTPNGDDLNDKFEIKGRFIQDFKIRIFNGMGHLIYTSTNINESWDGTFQGTPMPVGVYAYEVVVTSANSKIKRRTGTVTLLR